MPEVIINNNINLKLTQSLSKLSGVRYPPQEDYQQWNVVWKIIWNVYAEVIHYMFIIEISFLFVRTTHSADLGVFCAAFTGIGFILSFLFKVITFNRRRQLFHRLFNEVRSVSNDLLANPFDRGYDKFYDSHFVKHKKILMGKLTLEFAATGGLIMIFIIRSLAVGVPKNAVTPAITWTPYDNSQNPAYSLTCFAEMVIYCSAVLRSGSCDVLVWCMLFVPTIQLRYLNHLMGVIIAEDNQSSLVENEGERVQLNANFIWWVKYHQRVLRAIASPYLVVNYLTNLVILFLAGLALISMEEWDIFQQVIINGVLISNVVQLYIISLTGDWLRESVGIICLVIDESEVAADPGFSSLLFSGDRSLRMNYLYVCARTKRSLDIRFGGIHKLCSESFEQLIRLMLTYFVTIVQLREEKVSQGTV